MKRALAVAGIAGAVLVGGCASDPYYSGYYYERPYYGSTYYYDYGYPYSYTYPGVGGSVYFNYQDRDWRGRDRDHDWRGRDGDGWRGRDGDGRGRGRDHDPRVDNEPNWRGPGNAAPRDWHPKGDGWIGGNEPRHDPTGSSGDKGR